jgi:hypothetical protein
MQFVEIEGSREEIRKLREIAGVTLPRGTHDLGGGRRRASGYVTDEALAELRRRGLTVRVLMDDEELRRRDKKTEDMMRDVFERERAEKQQKAPDDSSGSKKP